MTSPYTLFKIQPNALLIQQKIIIAKSGCYSVSSGWMDILEVLASGMTESRGDSAKACFNSWSSTDAISLSAISQLSLSQSKARSPNRDDAKQPWHFHDQVGIMWDHHEFGECWLSQESVVRSLKISDQKLYSYHAEIFPSPEGYGKSDLTDRGFYYTRDYAMERSPTGA
jgi:hypothetical protein